MKGMLCLALLAFVCNGVLSTESKVTPVQQVINMMNSMLEKGKAEKHDEQVQYAAYKQFCDDVTAEKTRLIAEANEKIDVLKADIQKYAAEAERLTKEIAEHDEDIVVWKGDEKAATSVREIEKADYDLLHKDYSESIDALERAIAVLKKQDYDRKQASFVQLHTLTTMNLIPDDAKKAINTFLAQDDPESVEGIDVTAPEANAYEFQSGHIIEMLEQLLDKFVAERTALEKEEMNSVSAYQLLMQDLKAQIAQAIEDRTEKSEAKAKDLEAKAGAEADLADTTSVRDADEKYLSELTATCSQKASDFEARQALRAEELEAIQTAIDIISSSAVTGNADKYLPTLLQKKAAVLSQLRADGQSSAQARVVAFLRDRATQLNSRVLSALAVRAKDDPFAKVKKMIKDLIVRLMEEANEEATHKGWCDTELATNEHTRKEKTEAVETLHAEIDELEASVAKLTEEIAELTQEVADLDTAMAEATKLREEEKEKNAVTVADAQEAQVAVEQALTVLKEFYAKAAEATALLQQQPTPPPIFDSPYKGMQGENGGVVGMLEVIESDFARLEADTKAAEATAQEEYETFMTDSEVDKSTKTTDIKHKTAQKEDEEQMLVIKKKDLEGTQKELDAALAYFDKLKPSCVDAAVSYEERVKRRKEEIESLQEALKILNGKEIGTLEDLEEE